MRVLPVEIDKGISITAGEDGGDNSFNRCLLPDMLASMSAITVLV
jgi:hypothetical protein